MMSEEQDPYAPPRCEVEVSRPWVRERSRGEKVLRWVGAGCVVALAMGSLLKGASTDMGVKVTVTGIWGVLLLAFLMGGRKSHLALSLFLLLCVAVNGYFIVVAYKFTREAGLEVMLDLVWVAALSVVACGIALGCAVALFVKGRKRV